VWRIWYADGSTVDSTQSAPAGVPGHGLEVIVQPDSTPGIGNVGYVRLAGFDWYYWRSDDEEWGGAMGDPAIFDLILHREPIVGICQGRRISRARFEAIKAEAANWAEAQGLPVKSARRPDEIMS
jgi:hypothetical protein